MTLDALSNNRREQWDYFLNMRCVEFLTTLTYFKLKQDYEQFLINKSKRG